MSSKSDKITAIVLAAGQSKRMGRPKLILPWSDSTIIETTVTRVAAADIDDLIVVTGAYMEQVLTVLDGRYKTVWNDEYEFGEMLSSLQTGIHALPDWSRAILVMMGDMPLVETATINEVIQAFRAGEHDGIVAPVAAGTRGHPVIFGAEFLRPLLELKDDTPRTLLKQHGFHAVPVQTESVLIDIDTPKLYEKYKPV